ncbi:MAG: winged helix-turn-helix domain-containing protein [Candidatus Aenigmarchaeota archaeon]|nr:winged helix-turn-helix domain-containing protein [Candidatus Aenigmarchaeota archaeon]
MMYKLPLTFPEERKKRSYFEEYKDVLSALYLFDNLSSYQLSGICNLGHPIFKELIEFAKKREQIEKRRKNQTYLYKLTEKGLNCLSCWKYLEKRFDLADLVSSVLPYFEIEPKCEEFLSEKPKPLEFHRKRSGINIYLSFLNAIGRSTKPLCITGMMEKENLSYEEVDTLRKIGTSKAHIELKSGERKEQNFMLTEKGKELLESFSRYVTRFDLQLLF